jgi:hypothetical protein
MTMKSNANEVAVKLSRALSGAVRGAEAGLYAAASIIMTEAKRRAPLDKGPLRSSGYVTLPFRKGDGAEVEAGFGGQAKEYAVIQHERLDFAHDVGEAKYLENAIASESKEAGRVMGKIVEEAMRKGGNPPLSKEHPETPT